MDGALDATAEHLLIEVLCHCVRENKIIQLIITICRSICVDQIGLRVVTFEFCQHAF
jgi:hypothetical protein